MNYFLNHFDSFAIGAGVLIAFWWLTGRLAVVGYAVRLLWLPFQVFFWVLWAILVEPVIGIGFLVWLFWSVNTGNPAWVPQFFGILALQWLSNYRYFFRDIAEWYPTALRTPAPKAGKPPPPPPLVEVLANAGGWHDSEQKIIRKLPPHLQQLIAGGGDS